MEDFCAIQRELPLLFLLFCKMFSGVIYKQYRATHLLPQLSWHKQSDVKKEFFVTTQQLPGNMNEIIWCIMNEKKS